MSHDDSPFFTVPRFTVGQMVIPMGTAHRCPTCGNSFICDAARCKLSSISENCPTCAKTSLLAALGCGDPLPHSERQDNLTIDGSVQELDTLEKPEQGSLF